MIFVSDAGRLIRMLSVIPDPFRTLKVAVQPVKAVNMTRLCLVNWVSEGVIEVARKYLSYMIKYLDHGMRQKPRIFLGLPWCPRTMPTDSVWI